jgi:hypothetical protein
MPNAEKPWKTRRIQRKTPPRAKKNRTDGTNPCSSPAVWPLMHGPQTARTNGGDPLLRRVRSIAVTLGYLLPCAFCLMPCALCLMPYALCLMSFALCLLPYALRPIGVGVDGERRRRGAFGNAIGGRAVRLARQDATVVTAGT